MPAPSGFKLLSFAPFSAILLLKVSLFSLLSWAQPNYPESSDVPVIGTDSSLNQFPPSDPIQGYFCGDRTNLGYKALKKESDLRKQGLSVDCDSAKAVKRDPAEELYCTVLRPTAKSIQGYGLSESEILRLELLGEFRRRLGSSRALSVLKTAYEDYQTRSAGLVAQRSEGCAQLENESRLQQLQEEFGEQIYCLSGNRQFAELLTQNLDRSPVGLPGNFQALLRSFGRQDNLIDTANEWTASKSSRSKGLLSMFPVLRKKVGAGAAEIDDADLPLLFPLLDRLPKAESTPADLKSHAKLCYYAGKFEDSLHKKGSLLHQLDQIMINGTAGLAATAAILDGIPHPIARAGATGSAFGAEVLTQASVAMFSYQAIQSIIRAAAPQDSLALLSLFLETNPYDNSCESLRSIPYSLQSSQLKDHDLALLWDGVLLGSAAYCSLRCVDAAKAVLRIADPKFRISEIQSFLKNHAWDIQWSFASHAIVEKVGKILKAHPLIAKDLETAEESGLASVILSRMSDRVSAGVTRGVSESAAGNASTHISQSNPESRSDESAPAHLGIGSSPSVQAQRCISIPAGGARKMYRNYLALSEQKIKSPESCLSIRSILAQESFK